MSAYSSFILLEFLLLFLFIEMPGFDEMKKLICLIIAFFGVLFAFSQEVHLSSGTLKRFEKFPSRYVDPRTVDVWLPDGYSTGKKYAVIYMQDGQALFDSTTTWNHQEWGVDETMGKLIKENKIRQCIVVAIWNNGIYRHAEYFPQKAIPYLSDTARRELMPWLKDDPRGDRYLSFLALELKPFIDSSFSTLADQGNNFIMGSSMGALLSLYAICEYPELFCGAACLSTHWLGIFRKENNEIPRAILAYLKDHLPGPRNHRIYFDHGTKTLDSLYSEFQIQVDELMKAKGFRSNNWESRVFEGADHSEKAWNQRLSIPLIFLMKKGSG
jgi:enterochelin esterase-like enzyme